MSGNIKNSDLLLYAITDDGLLKGRALGKAVEDAILGGATIIQLRHKNAALDVLLEEAGKLKEITSKYNVPLIINDDIRVCIEAGADGVHLGQKDMDIASARELLGKDKIIGVSAKTPEQAIKAERGGADYLGVGAAFSTGTKADATAIDHSMYQKIRSAVSIPIVAIGGINAENLSELAGTGIDGVAVVSAIFGKDDIKKATEDLRRRLEGCRFFTHKTP